MRRPFSHSLPVAVACALFGLAACGAPAVAPDPRLVPEDSLLAVLGLAEQASSVVFELDPDVERSLRQTSTGLGGAVEVPLPRALEFAQGLLFRHGFLLSAQAGDLECLSVMRAVEDAPASACFDVSGRERLLDDHPALLVRLRVHPEERVGRHLSQFLRFHEEGRSGSIRMDAEDDGSFSLRGPAARLRAWRAACAWIDQHPTFLEAQATEPGAEPTFTLTGPDSLRVRPDTTVQDLIRHATGNGAPIVLSAELGRRLENTPAGFLGEAEWTPGRAAGAISAVLRIHDLHLGELLPAGGTGPPLFGLYSPFVRSPGGEPDVPRPPRRFVAGADTSVPADSVLVLLSVMAPEGLSPRAFSTAALGLVRDTSTETLVGLDRHLVLGGRAGDLARRVRLIRSVDSSREPPAWTPSSAPGFQPGSAPTSLLDLVQLVQAGGALRFLADQRAQEVLTDSGPIGVLPSGEGEAWGFLNEAMSRSRLGISVLGDPRGEGGLHHIRAPYNTPYGPAEPVFSHVTVADLVEGRVGSAVFVRTLVRFEALGIGEASEAARRLLTDAGTQSIVAVTEHELLLSGRACEVRGWVRFYQECEAAGRVPER